MDEDSALLSQCLPGLKSLFSNRSKQQPSPLPPGPTSLHWTDRNKVDPFTEGCCFFDSINPNAATTAASVAGRCPPRYNEKDSKLDEGGDLTSTVFRKEIIDYALVELKKIKKEMIGISLKIHSHPELGYEEVYAHKLLTTYLASKSTKTHPLKVDKHWILPTAFRATFVWPPPGSKEEQEFGKAKRTVAFNSEIDALPAIGHACGHNLICMVGITGFLLLTRIATKFQLPVIAQVIGTPAEEGGGGKIKLLQGGGYKDVDVCLMAHPGPSESRGEGAIGPSLAAQTLYATWIGRTAHAAASPWDALNALDAANIAYGSISSLRQQILPSQRIHGIIVPDPKGWAPNVIPDVAGVKYVVRSPTLSGLEALVARVENCFKAAALATGTKLEMSKQDPFADMRNNFSLGDYYIDVMKSTWGFEGMVFDKGVATAGASTDMGNVTYALPGLQPGFGIPSVPFGGNHTVQFTASAKTPEAHEAAFKAAVGLVGVAVKVIGDETFYEGVKKDFDEMEEI